MTPRKATPRITTGKVAVKKAPNPLKKSKPKGIGKVKGAKLKTKGI